MIYNAGKGRYELVLMDVGANLKGRDLMISTDEGGAYSVRIK